MLEILVIITGAVSFNPLRRLVIQSSSSHHPFIFILPCEYTVEMLRIPMAHSEITFLWSHNVKEYK